MRRQPGDRGRIGVFEMLEMTDELRAFTLARADAATIGAAAMARGMRTMAQNGLAKVLLGETTAEDVMRVAV